MATKSTVVDIHLYCMGETFISVDPDGRFWKKMNGCKADEQTKKSRASDLVSAVQDRSMFNVSVRNTCGAIYFGVDTGGVIPLAME